MSSPSEPLTPMMAQLERIKADHPDELLAFRVGDFYEFYGPDAIAAAPILNIVLTARKTKTDKLAMCGIPYHAVNAYLKKLVDAGQRVALCDQMEDASKTKQLVKRAVVRVVTAGTLTEDDWLDADRNNFLAAVCPAPDLSKRNARAGLAWLDVSTGAFYAADIAAADITNELARIRPAEVLFPDPDALDNETLTQIKRVAGAVRAEDPGVFEPAAAERAITDRFDSKTLAGFGLESGSLAVRAAGALLYYLTRTHGTGLAHLSPPTSPPDPDFLQLDDAALVNLEILQTRQDGKKKGSLLGVLDKTKTAPGARKLRQWLTRPLMDIGAIVIRLDAVSFLKRDNDRRDDLRETLGKTADMERLLARASAGRVSPKDIAALRNTFAVLDAIYELARGTPDPLINGIIEDLRIPKNLRAKLDSHLVDDPPADVSKGDIIRAGVHAELDRLRDIRGGGQKFLADIEATEKEKTGIPTLKVRYNKVFGYYIEITRAHAAKVPPHYIRKQTTVNSERYITPELKQIEDDLLHAADQIDALEKELFESLVALVVEHATPIRLASDAVATLDVLTTLAELAVKNNWVRPELTAEPVLHIVDGRHPVIEAALGSTEFVPNDADFGSSSSTSETGGRGRIMLITGPNMAGKSTYIRQVALIVIMAQTGSFVPATEAVIGIADRIFTRIGASDNLAAGQSTFMVEMTEVARLLNNVTDRSLVILDEVGRGTSTYDGLSLAWAIVEYLHDAPGKRARALFATHYHELTELADACDGVFNVNVSVKEWRGELRFLHRIVSGPADKSYGIGVARLAGLPSSVLARAKEILAKLEAVDAASQFRDKMRSAMRGNVQLPLFQQPLPSPTLDALARISTENLSPREAWDCLDEFVKRAKKEWETH